MKRLLLSIFALLLGINSYAMDAPMAYVGKKRPASQIAEIAPEAKEGRTEKSREYLFSEYPEEIQQNIRSFLDTAPGFGMEKLYNAAKNIRAFRLVSKIDRQKIDDPVFVDTLIQLLAKNFTYNNVAKVAVALHTKSAADWLNDALQKEANKNPEDRRVDLEVTFELIDQLNNGHIDAARFLLNAAKVAGTNKYYLRFLNANVDHDTLLQGAAKAGDKQLFDAISAHSFPVLNHVNKERDTALIIAISNDHTSIALALLQAGASPLAREGNTIVDTALLRAAFKNNTQVAQGLLNHPQINQMINFFNDEYPFTPIYYAAEHNNYPMFQALLAIPGVTLNGDLLYEALSKNTQMVKDLVAADIEANQADSNNRPAAFGLFEVSENFEPLVSDTDARDRIVLLLPQLNVNSKDEYDMTLLMSAVHHAKAKTVEKLLEANADVSLRDDKNYSALDYARKLKSHNKDHIIKMLAGAAAKQGVQL